MSCLIKRFFVQNVSNPTQMYVMKICAFWTKNFLNKQLILAKNYEIFKILLNSTGQKNFLKKCQKTAERPDFRLA